MTTMIVVGPNIALSVNYGRRGLIDSTPGFSQARCPTKIEAPPGSREFIFWSEKISESFKNFQSLRFNSFYCQSLPWPPFCLLPGEQVSQIRRLFTFGYV
jgi:hypothetical protein